MAATSTGFIECFLLNSFIVMLHLQPSSSIVIPLAAGSGAVLICFSVYRCCCDLYNYIMLAHPEDVWNMCIIHDGHIFSRSRLLFGDIKQELLCSEASVRGTTQWEHVLKEAELLLFMHIISLGVPFCILKGRKTNRRSPAKIPSVFFIKFIFLKKEGKDTRKH